MNFTQSEKLQGGSTGCGLAVFNMGISILGASIGFVTLNPVGTILGVAGIYGSAAAVAINC